MKVNILFIFSAILCSFEVSAGESKYTNQISFIFYNGSRITDYKIFNFSDALNIFNESYFNRTAPTVFYLHGWTERPLTQGLYSTDIVTQGFFRSKVQVNLIVLDYSNLVRRYVDFPIWIPRLLNELFAYITAVLNARHIGRALATFLTSFVPVCDCLPNIHMIGFSLGAQILSVTARAYGRGRIHRITGLEPANPFYEQRLQPFLTRDDAKFVDIIHTDAGILGFWESVGTVDFRPNMGFRWQPNCRLTGPFECSHYSSVYFFATSIYAPELFLARRCHNSVFWKLHLCDGNDVAHMGYFVEPDKHGDYYLRTQGPYPYGLGSDGLN